MHLNKKKLNSIAKQIRLIIFETIINAGKGHIGGAFSCSDILTALYFGKILKINPKNLMILIEIFLFLAKVTHQ